MTHDYRSRSQAPAGNTGITSSPADIPGKRTLTESLFQSDESTMPAHVQRKQAGTTVEGNVHKAAQRGIADSGSRLPHLDLIQRSFGSHDVSNVQSHSGEAAQRASSEIGAQAYAMGNHVAFVGTPDLHTAAHEAAHVVQQRAGVSLKGGVGEAGDTYEQHADRVADLVVAGQSAESALDKSAGTAGRQRHETTQMIQQGCGDGNPRRDDRQRLVDCQCPAARQQRADRSRHDEDVPVFQHFTTFHTARSTAPAAPTTPSPAAPATTPAPAPVPPPAAPDSAGSTPAPPTPNSDASGDATFGLDVPAPAPGPYPTLPPESEEERLAELTDPGEDPAGDTAAA